MGQNEFIYPIGTEPQSVWSSTLQKYGKDWDLTIASVNDIQAFYNNLQNMLSKYHIYLQPYEDITRTTGILAITEMNTTHYQIAKQSMSKSLFMYLDSNKESIFNQYKEPVNFIEAYRPSFDGIGFLQHILEARHPNLKDHTTRKTSSAPTYMQHCTIYEFINSYIEWINDEKLYGRTYTHKEKLDHALECLDTERWEPAIRKINNIIDDLYIDKLNPKPIPEQLHLTSRLAIYMVKQLPQSTDLSTLENVNPTVNKIARGNKKTVKNPYSQSRKSYSWDKREKENKADTEWAKNLEWTVLPGATCPACGKNNHNIYKTGCPTMATFCTCKEFYDNTPKHKLEPVKKQYQKYLTELKSKMAKRRNDDRATLKRIQDRNEYNDDDMAILKKTYFENYMEDFAEEQFRDENPFEDLEQIEDPEVIAYEEEEV
jgi:hypothetical protein